MFIVVEYDHGANLSNIIDILKELSPILSSIWLWESEVGRQINKPWKSDS